MRLTIDDVRSRFIKHFGGEAGSVYASPGRINLIGEHTDYNNGFVFPGAVEQGIIAEIKPNGTRMVDAYSIDLKDRVDFHLDDPAGPKASWAKKIVLNLLFRQGPQPSDARTLILYHLLKQFVPPVKQFVSAGETKSFSIFYP